MPKQEPSDEEALADILADLQEIGALDPEAQHQLLEDLRQTNRSLWPLMVRQFHATLAYRTELAAADTPPAQSKENEGADKIDDIGTAFGMDESPRPSTTASEPARVQPARLRVLPLPEPEEAVASIHSDKELPPGETSQLAATDSSESQVRSAVYQQPLETTQVNQSGVPDSETIAMTSSIREVPWGESLDLAIEKLRDETAGSPATSTEIADHVRLRMLLLIAGRTGEALHPIDGVPPNQQDYWNKQLFGLSTYLDERTQPDARQRALLARNHIDNAADLLGEMATLEVRNLAFCKSVRGFGIYEPLDEPRFSVGQQVTLYAEVKNYRSEPTESGFKTLLATSYEVLDENDRRVESGEFPQVEDVCRTRRRDFHIQYGVQLPTRIYPGTYRLQLTIEDMLSRKLGRASVDFEIVENRHVK